MPLPMGKGQTGTGSGPDVEAQRQAVPSQHHTAARDCPNLPESCRVQGEANAPRRASAARRTVSAEAAGHGYGFSF